jgi:hypothetical protein
MTKLDWLQTGDRVDRDKAFDRVEVTGMTMRGDRVSCSLLGVCYSRYGSGPGLVELADAVGELFGPGVYGWASCRRV